MLTGWNHDYFLDHGVSFTHVCAWKWEDLPLIRSWEPIHNPRCFLLLRSTSHSWSCKITKQDSKILHAARPAPKSSRSSSPSSRATNARVWWCLLYGWGTPYLYRFFPWFQTDWNSYSPYGLFPNRINRILGRLGLIIEDLPSTGISIWQTGWVPKPTGIPLNFPPSRNRICQFRLHSPTRTLSRFSFGF